MSVGIANCVFCKYMRDKIQCEAFPRGIPFKILSGKNDHRKPYKGDNDIQFEPIKKKA